MKFYVRIIQFDILLVLNKHTSTFKNSPILVKFKTKFLHRLEEITTGTRVFVCVIL